MIKFAYEVNHFSRLKLAAISNNDRFPDFTLATDTITKLLKKYKNKY